MTNLWQDRHSVSETSRWVMRSACAGPVAACSICLGTWGQRGGFASFRFVASVPGTRFVKTFGGNLMKKLLLGSTMLIGAALVASPALAQAQRNPVTSAAPFSVNLGGYHTFAFQMVGGEKNVTGDVKPRSYDFKDDTRLTFDITARSDNGLTYGFRHRLRLVPGRPTNGGVTGQNAETNNFDFRNDRSFAFLRSPSFGNIELGTNVGSNDNRVANPTLFGPGTGLGFGPDGGFMEIAANRGFGGLGYLANGESITSQPLASRINYNTPSFSGFSVGVSFAPDAQVGRGGDRTDFVASGSTSPLSGANNIENLWEVNALYQGTFSGVGIDAGIAASGYSIKDRPNATFRDYDNAFGIQGRLSVTYSGFTGYGSYAWDGKSGYAKRFSTDRAVSTDAARGFTLGLGYASGPFAIGAIYGNAKSEGDILVGGDDSLETFTFGGHYTITPGMMLFGGIEFFRFKDEGSKNRGVTVVNSAGPVAGTATRLDGNSGTVFTLGTHIRF